MFKKDIKEMIDNEFDQLYDQPKDQKIADGITLISFPIVITMKRSDSMDDYCALDKVKKSSNLTNYGKIKNRTLCFS